MAEKSVLRTLREMRGDSRRALSEKSAIAEPTIRKYESGERDLTPGAAEKLAQAFDVDAVRLYLAHTYGAIKAAEEEGDPNAADKALVLARKLLEILEEGDLDEERADEVRTIIEELLQIVEGATAARSPIKPEAPGKPVVPLKPAAKSSPGEAGGMDLLRRLGGMSRVGGITEDEAYDRLVEEGLSAPALEKLLDDISARMSDSLVSDAEMLTLEALQAAIERRLAELAGDGDRSSFRELAGDRAAAIKAAASEAQERRDYVESMREIGLDTFGRPLDPRRQEHARTLKSSEYDLTEDEIQTGVSRRGLPLIGKELERRRRI